MAALFVPPTAPQPRTGSEPQLERPLPPPPHHAAAPTGVSPPESGWSRSLPRLFRREKSREPELFGTATEWTSEGPNVPPRPSPSPSPTLASPAAQGRFRLGLGRSKSELDLRGGKEGASSRTLSSGQRRPTGAGPRNTTPSPVPAVPPLPPSLATPPALPGMELVLPPPLGMGHTPRSSARTCTPATYAGAVPGLDSPTEFPEPRTPTPGAYWPNPGRPPLPERATTGQLGVRLPATPATVGPSGRPLSGGRRPQTPESTRSRPSTANSATTGSPGAMRVYPSTPPSWADSASARSTLSSSYFAMHGRGRQVHQVVSLQAGWLQDDMLRELKLNERPADGERHRRQRDILLGALTNDVLRALTRATDLSSTAAEALTRQRDALHASRGAWHCEAQTVECQVVQNDLFYRLRRTASEEAFGRHRHRGERGERVERTSRERLENDLARFLYDAIDLPEVMDLLHQPLPPDTRETLGKNSSALEPHDVERLLGALRLSKSQQARVRTHVERCRATKGSLSPQGSLDSSQTAEHEGVHSP